MFTTIMAFTIAGFFALNIGASGAAASMGIAYGSGAIKMKRLALFICGIGIFLGAYFGGGEVVKTLGSQIIPEQIISIQIALVILVAAAISLFFANLSGIPLSTSEVTVGAVVGVGIAYKVVYVKSLTIIVTYWLIVPLLAFLLAFLTDKTIGMLEKKLPFLKTGKSVKILAALVILTGFLEAFSSGMNNVANAVGPLVASGIISIEQGTFGGGLFVALGAFLLGSNVIETNGKRITDLSLLQGSAVSGIGASLVITASLFGIPVPLTQITTCSILGIGVSRSGRAIWKKAIIAKLLKTWVISPLVSLVISYNLVKFFIGFDFSGLVMTVFFIATIYLFSLWKPARKAKQLYPEKAPIGEMKKLP